MPVELKKSNGSKEARGEDGADTEDIVAVEEAAEHLGVHGLEGVGTENGGVWAGVDVVRVERSVSEVLAFVVAS